MPRQFENWLAMTWVWTRAAARAAPTKDERTGISVLGRQKTPKMEDYENGRVYDYSTREGREATAAWLFQAAKGARTVKEAEWVRYNDYYNFIHGVSDEVRQSCRERGILWDAAVVPDPFIQVESQIDPVVPEPEFRGRDDDMDSAKAKQREYAVRYILQENRVEDLNTANERRLKKLGDAFWKAYWDATMDCGPYEGNIRVRDVPVESIYVDPAAGADGLEAAQYVDYVYTVHKVRFWQMYHRELEKRGLTLEDVLAGQYQEGEGLFDLVSNTGAREDTVQVLEHWFKQPFDTWEEPSQSGSAGQLPQRGSHRGGGTEDGENVQRGALVPAGSVACSIQAGGKEVKYIPNYWKKTGRQNQKFPFVHYWCIRDENEFYNKSELLPILALTDAADRALATGQMNDAMTANDMIVREEGALADGCEITNEPGAEIVVKPQHINAVRRLGGLGSGANSLPMVNWLLEQIQRANRNYETNLGKESARVTTASGLMQLRSDADSQSKIKKADRNAGFARLYELLDALALEFFDDGRLLFIGAKSAPSVAALGGATSPVFDRGGSAGVSLRFNGDEFATVVPEVRDAETDDVVRQAYRYWPRVDVTVNAGDGVVRSKAATLEALDKLSQVPVTAENYKILAAELEILDIPQKQEIVEMWEERFRPVAGMGDAPSVAAFGGATSPIFDRGGFPAGDAGTPLQGGGVM